MTTTLFDLPESPEPPLAKARRILAEAETDFEAATLAFEENGRSPRTERDALARARREVMRLESQIISASPLLATASSEPANAALETAVKSAGEIEQPMPSAARLGGAGGNTQQP